MPEVPANFKITALLCDAAQAVNGKLYILGGGWTVTHAVPQPSAVALVISVPWGESNKKHKIEIELVDTAGKPFPILTPAGEQPLKMSAEFETGRPPGIAAGSYLAIPLAIGIGPLQYKIDRYEWRFKINGVGSDDWKLPFEVKAPPGQAVYYPQS